MSGIVRVFAPAKVNLTLHVTGQREDGYHLIDSLVVFATVGDNLRVSPASAPRFSISGPESSGLEGNADNLVLKVAQLVEDAPRFSFELEKNLPVSSGIGGGSADAAATFRGLVAARYGVSDIKRMAGAMAAPLLALGADIPMCIQSEPARVRGIGNLLQPLQNLPALDAVLVNPRLPVSTPAVFKSLMRRDNPPMPDALPPFRTADAFVAWVAAQRNDLEAAAIGLEPAILDVQKALSVTDACILARMSGSGATCFGIYPTADKARDAAAVLAADHPGWWVRAVRLDSQARAAVPSIT